MNNNKLSSAEMLKVLGCFIFDVASILAYIKALNLFLIIAPIKSTLILLVLLLGLIILNGVVVFQNGVSKFIGVPYSVSIAFLAITYVVLANVLSIFLVLGSTVWYVVWEFTIFSIFLIITATVINFSKRQLEDNANARIEREEKTSIMLELLEIEEQLKAKENLESILVCFNLFKVLKERIQASTPFGRITGNSAVLRIEEQIKNNLLSIKIGLQGNLTDKDASEMQRLIEDTRRLVINRETLNIK